MKHLSDDALLDLAERETAGHSHLDTCEVCRTRVASLRHTMAVVERDRVPEPSPLFWKHFSDRLAHAIDAPPPPTSAWLGLSRWGWAATAVAAIVAVVLIVNHRMPPESSTASSGKPVRMDGGADNTREAVSWTTEPTDESWQIVEGAAGDLDLETAVDAGIVIREGSLDRELMMLSDQERRELARAIRLELERPHS